MIKKWQQIKSNISFQDKWLKIQSNSYRLGNNQIIEPYHIIEYPDWINILPITTDLNVLVIKQYRPGTNNIVTEIPGGIVESQDPTPDDTAKRELLEETGYGNGIFFKVGSYFANPANQNNITHSFLAINLEKINKPKLEVSESLELHKIPLLDFLNLIHDQRDNPIVQALHMTNLFYSLTYILKSQDEELSEIKKIILKFIQKP